MPQLFYATTDEDEAISLRETLEPYGFDVIQRALAMPEPRLDRVSDTAAIKAIMAYQEIGQPVVANDSGFFLLGLNGFPRGFVNFALETIKLDSLIKLAGTYRRAEFHHALAFHDGGSDAPKIFEDVVRGKVSLEPRGQQQPWHLSALATIFIPDGLDRTLAELSREEYRDWRRSSTEKPYGRQFLEWYQQHRTYSVR